MAASSSSGTLVKDPTTGAYTLAPGMGSNPLGSTGSGASGGKDPYTLFNTNLASILTQIQAASAPKANALGAAADALTTEGVGVGGNYNPAAAPGVNLQAQTGGLSAFAPAVTSVNTQLANASSAIGNLGTEISGLETAYKPTAIGPGESTITPSGDIVHQGHSYTPTVNPQTGLVDGFDQNTGTWASADGAGGGSGGKGGSGSSDPIEAVFGKSNPIGAYATDPNYVKEISGLYSTVSSLGVANNPDSLDAYIANNAKNAPVTGQMIINAAQTYDVDPALLATVLLHESDFGTAGAAVKTMNPGNQGNTGTSTQAFGSWQQGVMATAKNLAARISAAGGSSSPSGAGGSSTGNTTATSAVGGSFSTEAAAKVGVLPAALQSYVDAGPLGVAYINDDRVPAAIKQSLQTLAARAGIPYVQPADVGAIKSIETVLGNLDSMQQLAQKTLGSGLVGRGTDALIGPLAEGLQTGWGRQLGLFDNYRDTAIKAVQALAGGAGSGLRINMGEIAANTQNLPKSSDNLENATANIQQLKQLIYTQLSTTFPYAQIQIKDANGNVGTIPAGNLTAAISRGASVI